jgi:hypothetical protein
LLKTITGILEKFVKGNLSISKDRLYAKPNEGGLGLIELDSFICSQQSLWVKRALDACCDNWREDLFNLTYGNPVILHPDLIDRTTNPIIFNISVSYLAFKSKFLQLNDNYKKSNLLYNPILHRNRVDKQLLDINFFRQNPPINLDLLSKIMVRDIAPNGIPVPVQNLNDAEGLNIGINLITYMRTVGACTNLIQTRNRVRFGDNTCISIKDFFKSFKKGSAGIRKIIFASNNRKSITDLQPVKTFFRITEIPVCEPPQLKTLYSLWSLGVLNNKMREFCFKFYNNCLGLNTRTSHFVQNVNRACSFCKITDQQPSEETFLHLFYTCPKIAGLRDNLFEKYFNELGPDQTVKKKFWFGIAPGVVRNKILLTIAVLTIQFWIWNFKLKDKLPNQVIIEKNLFYNLEACYRLSKNLFLNDNTYALSRNWEILRRNELH